jgi:hypothetical protein
MHMRVVVWGVHLLPGVPACAGLCIAPSDAVFVLACLSAKLRLVACLVWSPLQGEGCSVDSDGRGTPGATVHVFILADMMFSWVAKQYCWLKVSTKSAGVCQRMISQTYRGRKNASRRISRQLDPGASAK